MKKVFYSSLIALYLTCSFNLSAQVAVNSSGALPDASAMFDVSSSDKGVLIPRMTLLDRDSIVSPAQGLLVFVADDQRFYIFDGTGWEKLLAGVDGGWNVSGNNLVSGVSGNVGIGTENPVTDLEVSDAGSNQYENAEIRVSLFSDGSSATPRFTFSRSRSPEPGDLSSASAVTLDGDILGRLSFSGIRINGEGGSSSGAGWFEMIQKGSTTAQGVPGQFQVVTADGLGARTTRFVVSPNGNVGIGTEIPTARLDVEGTLDMNKNQIKNMVIENRTSDPSSPAVGQIWLRTDL